MEFRRESEMLKPVKNWLESLHLAIKTEFVNPWGICDIVGCSLRREGVDERLALGQRGTIGPPLRVALLARIPDRKTGRAVTLKKLTRDYRGILDEESVEGEIRRLVKSKFVQVTERGSYQKLNGWFPLQERLITVELKLSRIGEALEQAIANRDLTSESYAAFPMSVAERIQRGKSGDRFEEAGVGLIGVTSAECRVLIEPSRVSQRANRVAEMHCVERFWRGYLKAIVH